MTEDELVRALPLADRLRVAAVDLAVTGAPKALVAAVWEIVEAITRRDACYAGSSGSSGGSTETHLADRPNVAT
jgi:hypothetical protein